MHDIEWIIMIFKYNSDQLKLISYYSFDSAVRVLDCATEHFLPLIEKKQSI